MINYIIQVGLFQVLFLGIYDFLLRKETFYNWNRVYLLATPLFSFGIPFLKISAFKEIAINTTAIEYLPQVILNPQQRISKIAAVDVLSYLPTLLLIGSGIMTLLFLYKLSRLFILRKKNKTRKKSGFTLVIIDKPGVVFSFFKSIFIDKTFLEQKNDHIISHEMVHIKNYHSIDLLVFEVLKIISWFIPTVYIFQNRMAELHEFIADAKTIQPQNKQAFFNNLLAATFKLTPIDFVNQFYKHSLIKKRIIMANKQNSKQVLKFKYLLLVPALASMLLYSSCEQKKQTIEDQVVALKANIAKKDTLSKAEIKGIISLAFTKDILKKLPITDSTHVEVERVYSDNVPFAIIEQVPIYPGCKDAKNQKGCFSGKITTLVAQNFDVELAKDLNLKPGKKRIFVMFTIDKAGKVVNIKSRAPHKKLEEEAIRVIKLIPQLKPGKQKGKAVTVKYSLPIVFNVD